MHAASADRRAGCQGDEGDGCRQGGLSPALTAKLDKTIDDVRKQAGIPGAVVGLWMPGKGNYLHTSGVADKAKFVQGDMYEADISKATVLALFLLPENLRALTPKFLELRPGARIVANSFAIEDWGPAGLFRATPGRAEARRREWFG